jgi:MFS-type transporter involved in bile tolerance (Atg22 family)
LRGTAVAGGIALFNMFGNLGAFFGPTLVGILTNESRDYSAGLMAVAIWFVFAALIIVAVGRAIPARTLATRQTV